MLSASECGQTSKPKLPRQQPLSMQTPLLWQSPCPQKERSQMGPWPQAMLLLQADATVTICHSRTRDIAAHTRRADVLIAAVGRARMITGDMIKPGAIVIDVGMNRDADGKLCGDVDFESAARVAGAITPVPGGVGPMTRAMLLVNTLEAAERQP